jgi:hypothetical protein
MNALILEGLSFSTPIRDAGHGMFDCLAIACLVGAAQIYRQRKRDRVLPIAFRTEALDSVGVVAGTRHHH